MPIMNSAFFDYSKEIASRFLMAAVIIDDRAAFSSGNSNSMPTRLKTPPIINSTDDEIPGHTTDTTDEINDAKSNSTDSHDLDAKIVIDSFAKKGIFCSVLKPNPDELTDMRKITREMASRSDVIIVDWVIPNESEKGETALQVLEDVAANPRQLKLFIVYTGEPALDTISGKIKKLLDPGVSKQDKGLTLIKNSIRICIYAKPDTKVRTDQKDRIVSFSNLTDICIEEFTKMTDGLVSNVALDAISQIRINTPAILNTFSKDLDPPYLTHRVLSPEPDDAEHHLTAWIAQEMNAVIEEADVCRHVRVEAITKWVNSRNPIIINGKKVAEDDVTTLISNGVGNFPHLSKNKKEEAHKFLTKSFAGDELSENADEKLAFLSTIRSFYTDHVPFLTQGSVVKKLNTKVDMEIYYVCVQPRCDCVRLEAERKFLFLPLKKVSNGKFDIVICHNGQYLRFAYEKNPYHLHIETFQPLPNQSKITFKRNRKGQFCKVNKTKQKFEWLGELHWEHSQRLSTDLSGNLARVGLNESEWLRRSAR